MSSLCNGANTIDMLRLHNPSFHMIVVLGNACIILRRTAQDILCEFIFFLNFGHEHIRHTDPAEISLYASAVV